MRERSRPGRDIGSLLRTVPRAQTRRDSGGRRSVGVVVGCRTARHGRGTHATGKGTRLMIARGRTLSLAAFEFDFVGDAMGGEDFFQDVVFLGHRVDDLSLLLHGSIGGGNVLGIGLS